VQDWADLYDACQTQALNTRLGIPLLFGIDAVHGHNNVLGAVIFPHNIGLGCTRNPQLVERAAHITALEMRATGIQWAFAPCVAVPQDDRWGRTYEGFGETPQLASMFGEAAVRGLQGRDLSHSLSVLACAKHFVGDGATAFGTGVAHKEKAGVRLLDQGDVSLSEAEVRQWHIPGYLSTIQVGVGSIMVSYSSWNGVKCSGNRQLLTEILKQELGFEGILISDYGAVHQLDGDAKSQIEQTVNAGMDIVMLADRYQGFHTDLMELVQTGRIPLSRIDDAVMRILRVKLALGLLEKGRSLLADRQLQAKVGSPQHRQVARECVRQSLVLLKNDRRVLPLSKRLTRIHVSGKSANDLGNQCGGWTITWQGKSGTVTTGGTTILQAIQATVSIKTEVVYARDGSNAAAADVGIVVIGETPYTEWEGDREDLSLDPEDLAVVDTVRQTGIPVVVILISGRPMVIEPVLRQCDAFVAAWLPGTEGRGVTDVLFGDYPPTGKLCCSWFRSMDQIPINLGDRPYTPLFRYGFGLTY
jgi:beta-glucosidase